MLAAFAFYAEGQLSGVSAVPVFRPVLAALLCVPLATVAHAADKPEQLVVVSFDGAHDNRLWERSLALGEKTGARFTYFLSCTFLMSKADAKSYKAPGKAAGRSNVGFAPDHADVAARLGHIWTAHETGHEIANHACGHFDGKDWSKADWLGEFERFDAALADAWRVAGIAEREPAGWREVVTGASRGFRAPYLSTGKGLEAALAARGFAYDASTVSKGPAMPDLSGAVARFALPMIPEGPAGKRVIAMDYNLFARHSGAVETPEGRDEFTARTLSAFRTAFEKEYAGERVPLQIGFHFVAMNGGAYWDALETFLTETCGKPGVACVSHIEALERLRAADGAARMSQSL